MRGSIRIGWVSLVLILAALRLNAQGFTNSGTDFWLGFPETYDRSNALFWLNIASDTATTGNVSIPGTGFSTSFTTTAGSVVKVSLPSVDADIGGSAVLLKKAIHVTSNAAVSVYAVTYHNARHEAALILPVSSLGKRYRGMTYPSEIKNGLRPSEILIVAAGDTAEVRITPSGNISGGFFTGVPFTVVIPPDHVYQIQAMTASDDLTGSLMESLNGKDFAVFGGNTWSSVVCGSSSDPLLEQLYPTNTWGTEYIAPITPVVGRDVIRIVADQDSTKVFRDGTFLIQLNAGQRFTQTVTSIHYYTANKPISVANIMVTGSGSCANNVKTDPSMTLLNPNEQMLLDSITFFAVDTSAIDTHFVQIVTRTKDTAKIYLDSVKLTGFQVLIQNTDYSWRSSGVTPGYHRLETDGCGFLAYSKGYGNVVSYGYATGVSLIDLENSVKYSNLKDGSDTLCIGDTTVFEAILKGTPLKFSWNLGNGKIDSVAKPTTVYTVPGSYAISATITYECLTDTLRDTVFIPPTPQIDLGPDTSFCQGDTLDITANTWFYTASWSTGDTANQLAITKAGAYWAKAENYCGIDRDTIQIDSVFPVSVNLGADTILCIGDSLRLDVETPNKSTYLWQDSSTLAQFAIPGQGTYWVQIANQCGFFGDTLVISPETIPWVDIGPDTALCNQAKAFLSAQFSRSTYLWHDGSTNYFHRIENPGGWYKVEVTNPCGVHLDSLYALYEYPLQPDLGPDSLICVGTKIILDPLSFSGACLWSDASTDTTYTVLGKGKYWVQITNSCGVNSDTIEFDEERRPSIRLPNDTLFCDGDTLVANAHFSRSSYSWSSGDTTASIVIRSPGLYICRVTNVCGFTQEAVHVLYDYPLQVDLGVDTILCDQEDLTLQLHHPTRATYEWNTGNQTSTQAVTVSGVYRVTVSNRCGDYIDEMEVSRQFTPEPFLPPRRIHCAGDVIGVSSGIAEEKMEGTRFLWDNGDTSNLRLVNESDYYWVEVSNFCGTARDTQYYQFNPIPELDLPDTFLCMGESWILDYTESPHQFNWINSEMEWEDNYFEIIDPDRYILTIQDSAGCLGEERFVVKRCPSRFYIPNSFSPNDEEPNNTFRVYAYGIFDYHLKVVNRWNEVVYESHSMEDEWDGIRTDNGTECPVGTYVYYIEYKEQDTHNVLYLTGQLQLLR